MPVVYAGKSDVLGSGEGIVITTEDLEFYKKEFVPSTIVPTEQSLLETFLRQKLFAKEAELKGYGDREDIKKKLEMIRERVIGRAFARDYMKKELKIDDSVVKSYYLSHIEEFSKPDTVHLFRIIVKDEGEAKELKARLEDGSATFEELAREYSLDPHTQWKSGELGWIPIEKLSKTIRRDISEAKDDSVIGPVEIKNFYYLFWVKERKPGMVIPFDKVKDELYVKVERQKSRELLNSLTETLKKKYNFKWTYQEAVKKGE